MPRGFPAKPVLAVFSRGGGPARPAAGPARSCAARPGAAAAGAKWAAAPTLLAGPPTLAAGVGAQVPAVLKLLYKRTLQKLLKRSYGHLAAQALAGPGTT